jgi:hypothetical protein
MDAIRGAASGKCREMKGPCRELSRQGSPLRGVCRVLLEFAAREAGFAADVSLWMELALS